jgi:hypothetical protein
LLSGKENAMFSYRNILIINEALNKLALMGRAPCKSKPWCFALRLEPGTLRLFFLNLFQRNRTCLIFSRLCLFKIEGQGLRCNETGLFYCQIQREFLILIKT